MEGELRRYMVTFETGIAIVLWARSADAAHREADGRAFFWPEQPLAVRVEVDFGHYFRTVWRAVNGVAAPVE
jgi:hypothetical protein